MVNILELFPEILPREPGSTFRRYVEAHEDELESFEDDIEYVNLSRQVDQAEGEDLNEIGRLFGPVGRRLGRDDPQYRHYLKSVVQSFSGRGTDLSMRRAFASALDIDIDDITLVEDTTNVEYDIILDDWTSHRVSTVYDIAQIVDPSGVDQGSLQYIGPESRSHSSDKVVLTPATQIVAGSESAVDEVLVNITLQETFDEIDVVEELFEEIEDEYVEETTLDDPTTDDVDADAGTDEALSTDDVLQEIVDNPIDVSESTESFEYELDDETNETNYINDLAEEEVSDEGPTDNSSGDDAVATETSTVLWDDGSWDSMRFADA